MIPLVPSILGLVAAVVLSFASGYKVRGDQEKAKQLEVERGWHEKYKLGVERANEAAEVAGLELRNEQAARGELAARLRAENARGRGTVRLAACPDRPAVKADAVVVSADVVGGGDRVVLSDEFRLRYDTALSLVVPAGDRAGWVVAAGAATDAADLWTVLENVTENAGRWAQCREMMTAAQTWFKQMGWVK